MSKHTPGPWHTGCFVNDAATCRCTSILCEGLAGSICQITVDNGKRIGEEGGNDGPPIDEAKANAYLIAAAPELLEALYLARPIVELAFARNPLIVLGDALDAVNAAIAKTTGAP